MTRHSIIYRKPRRIMLIHRHQVIGEERYNNIRSNVVSVEEMKESKIEPEQYHEKKGASSKTAAKMFELRR